MARIAVEESLNQVKEALQSAGHEVVAMNESSAQSCDCCVITGQDENVMGMADTTTQASVINAAGMTSEEIVEQVNRRLQ
ncbi:hypothetical protein DUZ99_00440 [Xylanibacillus composti]|uniref:YkuS family protein n=1 Tax=Xylanibacillus composti TaxID=1572762 RepID=UPI001BCEA294|nr:YkuS family protein [Xylanibacillus composti]MDT9723484.1 hypothetical protein [Xylanibacillus composti]